jgi:hypothetical protein
VIPNGAKDGLEGQIDVIMRNADDVVIGEILNFRN